MRDALMPTYSPPEILFSHGKGSYLYTDEGTEYLDFITGIAVNALGHAHPHLLETLTAQAQKLWHTSNLFRIPEGERLAERLTQNTFADKVFFANSGAEAIECGIKAIRRYFYDKGQPQRNRIIGMQGSFHGRTIATISAAGNPNYTKGFTVGDAGFDHVKFGDLDSARAAINENTAAILLEPVQGEGGIFTAPENYLKELRTLCDEKNILLMLDEVQCGNGRTGKLFAYEWAGIKPDILATAKGLGGGFPVGACLTTNQLAEAMVIGTHGSTFGGNPLAMAVANAVLDVLLADGFLDQVQQSATQLRQGLDNIIAQYPKIFTEIRGKGLMIGVKCNIENTRIVGKLRENFLLVGKAGDNVMRLLPPLNVSENEIQSGLNIIEQTCNNWTD